MNVQIIKAKLYNNPELIQEVLHKVGFSDISYNPYRDEVRCARAKGRNPTSIKVDIKTLKSACFSTNIYGDIITIVQYKLNENFAKTLQVLGNMLNINPDIKYTPPFGGFYHSIHKTGTNYSDNIKTYDDSILSKYWDMPSELFIKDNISAEIQKRYQIGYDPISKRIVVPWRYTDGRIGGITGRYNSVTVEDGIPKWLAVLPFQKHNFLYGYVENYHNIMKHGKCIITESEKGVMQASTYNINLGLSCGGSNVTDSISLIKSLSPDTTIIAFDEGLERDYIHAQAEKVKEELGEDTQVGYIYDVNNDVMLGGSKFSPTDLGREIFLELASNHVYYV